MPIDILAGRSTLRAQIEADTPLAEIVESWRVGEERFRAIRAPHLLY